MHKSTVKMILGVAVLLALGACGGGSEVGGNALAPQTTMSTAAPPSPIMLASSEERAAEALRQVPYEQAFSIEMNRRQQEQQQNPPTP